MKQLKCLVCGIEFTSKFYWTKTCSIECRKKHFNKNYGRKGLEKLSTNCVGAISELTVCVDLMRKGYSVFRAVAPHCLFDIVAYKENKILKVEVKTGYLSINGKVSNPQHPHQDHDILAVVIREENRIVYYDTERNELSI